MQCEYFDFKVVVGDLVKVLMLEKRTLEKTRPVSVTTTLIWPMLRIVNMVDMLIIGSAKSKVLCVHYESYYWDCKQQHYL